jgi:uncharacterized membrane protein YciS (DUF1049 family)
MRARRFAIIFLMGKLKERKLEKKIKHTERKQSLKSSAVPDVFQH